MENLMIRLERPEDYREVENLTREAFWNVYRPGCTEHFVLHEYRSNPDFIPELDFVMEEDGKLIGHIMFSKAELVLDDGTRKGSWTFGPISIHPDFKRKGYGLKLLQFALEKAREQGVGFLCMEGSIDFYSHAGFDLASKLGIHYHFEPREAEVPYFLAQELVPGWLKANGIEEATYCPPKGYFVADEDPEAFEAYEATFPEKKKQRVPGQLGFDGIFLETERILLRPWLEKDAPALFKYASDPEVGPRAGWPPHKSLDESLRVIRSFFHNDHTWAMELKETGEPIGCIGYMLKGESNIDIGPDDAEAGYWVARPYWNQGICTEALRRMIDYCFRENGFKTLWSDFFVNNPASGRVMEKCGFCDTGIVNWCSHLYHGEDTPVKVMRLDNDSAT